MVSGVSHRYLPVRGRMPEAPSGREPPSYPYIAVVVRVAPRPVDTILESKCDFLVLSGDN